MEFRFEPVIPSIEDFWPMLSALLRDKCAVQLQYVHQVDMHDAFVIQRRLHHTLHKLVIGYLLLTVATSN